MKFGNIHAVIYILWVMPILVVFCIWAQRKKLKAMKGFAQEGLLEQITVSYSRRVGYAKIFLAFIGAFFMMLALARPQWGHYWKESEVKGLDIMFAIDVSKSMLAQDIKPDRLRLSKMEVKNLVKELKGDRVSLIAFSGSAFLQCPLTIDYSGFVLALDNISVDVIPRGGTSIANAIDEAIRSYKEVEAENKVLIIISDGEKTIGDTQKAINKAQKELIEISCVGVGSKKGSRIPVLSEKGKKTFLKDNMGKEVKTSLDEKILKDIAAQTGGMYVHASESDFGLERIYKERLSKLQKSETEGEMTKAYKERFQLPLFIAFLALVSGLFLKEKGKNEEV